MWGQKKPRKKARGTRVQWVSKPGETPERVLHTPAFVDSAPPPWDVREELVIGRPFVTRTALKADRLNAPSYPFMPLELVYSHTCETAIGPGSLMVYAGPVRVTESKFFRDRYRDVKVMKHTFVTPIGRCIVHHLVSLSPA